MEFKEIPKKLIVVGGGVIGLELGSVYKRIGSEVEVVEFADKICPAFDSEVSSEFLKILKKSGIKFHLQTKVVGGTNNKDSVTLEVEDIKSGTKSEITGDYVLISTGRKPYTASLGLENIGIQTDKFGRVPIDKHFKTSAKGVFAIGDVVEGPMLAHKGEEEGVACVELICGEPGHVNYQAIPNVVYTHPEIAYVGHSEEELKSKGKIQV